MNELLLIVASVLAVSLASLIGISTLLLRKGALDRMLLVLLAFGAGTLLGGALFDIIPEAVGLGGSRAYQWIVGGIVLFFVMERFIHWHHHHHGSGGHTHTGTTKPFAYLNLFGDGVHNFLDGTIIAAAYLTSMELGIVATIAILFHELPQELGDFGILIHSGMTVRRALGYNFIVALTSVVGALVMFFVSSVAALRFIMLSVAGGGFLYIALSDLLPELHHETNPAKTVVQLTFLILGILLLFWLGIVFPD